MRLHSADLLALDRGTVRSRDADGHMRVAVSNLSKANVCPYLGDEIPGGRAMGLQSGKTYMLLRDPAELERAADTMNGKPILMVHKPVSASDHPHQIVAGAVGNDCAFRAPYLQGSLTLWDGDAIGAVDSRQQSELSCGYAYTADMTPGSYQGVRYDGVMRDIRFNHLALVKEGRAGPDVMVGDAALKRLRKIAMDGDNETLRAALVAVIGVMTGAEEPGKLDAVLKTLDNGSDDSPAMDAMRRRLGRQAEVRTARAHAADYAGRFPAANRLAR